VEEFVGKSSTAYMPLLTATSACQLETPGCLTLLEILQIYWNYFFPPGNLLEIYKVSWLFSGLVCEFARLSLIFVPILAFQSVSVKNISQ